MTVKNMYVTYDDDGNRHFWHGDDEVTEGEWMNRHPHMKGSINGRDRGTDSGQLGNGDDAVIERRKAEVRQGLRAQRQKAKASDAEREGGSVDELGQPRQ